MAGTSGGGGDGEHKRHQARSAGAKYEKKKSKRDKKLKGDADEGGADASDPNAPVDRTKNPKACSDQLDYRPRNDALLTASARQACFVPPSPLGLCLQLGPPCAPRATAQH